MSCNDSIFKSIEFTLPTYGVTPKRLRRGNKTGAFLKGRVLYRLPLKLRFSKRIHEDVFDAICTPSI